MKSRAISVWLLKETFDPDSALADDNDLEGPVTAGKLPTGARLYIHDKEPRQPWWREYLGVDRKLQQSLKAGLLFIPAGDRTCVITFGNSIYNLKAESYEYDFGLVIALNAVDPNKLRNTDTADPGEAKRQRTQTSVGSDLTYFDVESDTRVLKSITGAARDEHRALMKSVTGGGQIRFNTSALSSDLPSLCQQLVELYRREDYKTTFPNIRNVRPVQDPDIVRLLDEALVDALRERSERLQLAFPEIMDYAAFEYVRFTGSGSSDLFDELSFSSYLRFLDTAGVDVRQLSRDNLSAHRIHILDGNEDSRGSFSLWRCITFDTSLAGEPARFHLMDGSWFAVDPSFLNRVQTELRQLFTGEPLPPATRGHEADYNVDTADALDGVCLDKTDVSAAGLTQVEPCDVLYVESDGAAAFLHVKIGTGSADLSHLFYQGQNAATLIATESTSQAKLQQLIDEKAADLQTADKLSAAIRESRTRVIYGIVTRKPMDGGIENLPLFSQLSLARAAKAFRAMRIPVEVRYIADARPVTPPKPKTRRRPSFE